MMSPSKCLIVLLLSTGGCVVEEPSNNGEHGLISFGSSSHAVAGVPHYFSLAREADSETCFYLTKSCSPDRVKASRLVAASCADEGLCAFEGPDADGRFALIASRPGHSVLDVVADFPGEAGVHDSYPIEIGTLSELTASCVVHAADYGPIVSRSDCSGVTELAVGQRLYLSAAATGIDSAGEPFEVHDQIDLQVEETLVQRGRNGDSNALSLDAVAAGDFSVAMRIGDLEKIVQARVYSP